MHRSCHFIFTGRFINRYCRLISSSVVVKNTEAIWKVIESNSVGSKVLLISADDANSIELRKRATFELNRLGKNVFSFTVPTKYPTDVIVEECFESFQRSGCSTVITLGSPAISNTGKGMIALANNRVRKVRDLKSLSLNHLLSNRSIPLVSISTNISPSHYSSFWSSYNTEDEALVEHSCSLRDLTVVVATDIISGGKNDVKDYRIPLSATLVYIMTHVYDLIFCSLLFRGNPDSSFISPLGMPFKKAAYLLRRKPEDGQQLSKDEVDEAVEALSDICLNVARARIGLLSENDLYEGSWFGIIELCSVLIDTTTPITDNVEDSMSRRHYEITCTELLFAVLETIENGGRGVYRDDDVIYDAAVKARDVLCELADLSSAELLLQIATHRAGQRREKQSRTVNQSLSGDALLAGAETLEELRLEDLARKEESKDAERNIFNEENMKQRHRKSQKLEVLRSDFTSDALRLTAG